MSAISDPVFRGRPRWVKFTLAGILAVATALYASNLGYSGYSTYYAAAARSMSRNWTAFFFGALDPGGTMTLDKLSGFVAPQAVSIALFGFHSWSVDLPQVIEGLIAVFVGYLVGTRWRGHVVGLATASVLTLTPMLATMFGRPMEDGLLTMSMVLAFACWQRAAMSGRMPWLIGAGAWVAVGFQAKMLQSWLIVPALAAGYLLASRAPIRTRLLRVGVVGVITLTLSLSWITVMQFFPSGVRPYVDGSTNDNYFSMVFGYNGVDRIIPNAIPGAVPQLEATPGGGQSVHANHTATTSAGHSILKLFLPQFTTQIGWLYPAALAGVLLYLLPRLRRPDHDRLDTATVVTLVTWLGVTGAVLSVGFVPHATYFAVLALPLALLAVVGTFDAVRIYRRGGTRDWIPLVVLAGAQTAWSFAVCVSAPELVRWIAIPVVLLGITGTTLLVLARHGSDQLRHGLVAVGAAAMIGPLLWSGAVLLPGGGGSAADAYAGPRPRAAVVSVLSPSGEAAVTQAPPDVTHAGTNAVGDPTLSLSQLTLERYILADGATSPQFFTTDVMAVAVSFTLFSDHEVSPMGGFSRQAPAPSLDEFRAHLRAAIVRYVLLGDGSQPVPALDGIRHWVAATCTPTTSGMYRTDSTATQTLYDCYGKG